MSRQALIDELVVRYEELREQQTPVSAEILCRDCPELLDELKRQLHVLEAMNAVLEGGTGEDNDTPPGRSDTPGWPEKDAAARVTTGSQLRILRVHAAGGLGEVLVAYDEDLQREVALKRLHAPHRLSPQRRRRFQREAEITSHLEHPGIVPIHGMGRDAAGQPLYAMRLIRGDTLHEAIRRFHTANEPARPTLRELLTRFVVVCNTAAYAHSRGVLHRDIKPDNIILGPYGETLLIDWGLARTIGTCPERPPEAEPNSFEQEASLATADGAVLGTPAYMSPEQAAGHHDQLGPTSDVYSLGATLYALLTGSTPFQGGTAAKLLDQVKRGQFPHPRQRNRHVPAALEAICLKAMARQPHDRYPAAEALAADLEHWLADEPVNAWREPWALRARRWLGRHRTLVTAAAAVVIVATFILSGAAWLLLGAYRNESSARAQAEEHYLKARAAFEQMTEVVEHWMADAPLMEPVRRQLLEKPVQFYESFLEEKGNQPAFRQELAQAHGRLGDLYVMLHEHAKAEQAFQRALAFQEALVHDGAAGRHARHDLAATRNRLGVLLKEKGQYPQAEQVQRKAIAVYEELVAEFPGEPTCGGGLARTCTDLAMTLRLAGQFTPAEAFQRKAIQLGESLATDFPNLALSREVLASGHGHLAILLRETNRPHEAESSDRRALGEYERLVTEFNQVTKYRLGLAATHLNLGNHYSSLGHHKDAEQEYRRALQLHQQLADDFPLVPEHRWKLAVNWNNLGNLLRAAGPPAPAAAAYREALKLCDKLVAESPQVPAYRQHLALIQTHLGALLETMSQYPQAAAALGRAVHVSGELVAEFPNAHEYATQLARGLVNRGVFLAKRNQLSEAEQDFRQALKVQEEFAARLSSVATTPRWRRDRAEALNNLGECLRLQQRPQEAEQPSRQAVARYRELVAEFADKPEYRQGLATSLHTLALVLWNTAQLQEAEQAIRGAVQTYQELPTGPGVRSGRGDALKDLAEILLAGKQARAAVSAATESAQLLDSRTAYRHAAGVVAQCAALVKTDAPLAEEYAQRAVQLLRQALARGYQDRDDLRKAAAFDVLRPRADFQELLDALGTKPKQ